MKASKLLYAVIVGIIGFLPLSSHAQVFEWEMSPKYIGEMHVGYKTTTHSMGYNSYSGMVELGTLQGVSLNKYLDVAIGVDALMMTHYYSNCGLRFLMNTYLDIRPSYPITDKFKVFIDLGLGGYYNIKSKPQINNGFYCQFGPGFRYRKFNLSLGLQSFGTEKGSVGFYSKIGLYF